MNVYINKSVNYSDMQGPAPSGFHIPLTTEWQGLKTIMDGLGLTTGDNRRINLHMPFSGNRLYSDASISNQGTYGYYWSSSPYTKFPERASIIFIHSASLLVDAGIRSFGYPVRCFKNSFELPASSWTVINGTLGGAGIFWDTVNGLISITGDGATGYTIQDKNLGATTVYNNGDTLTQANMGNMYQWGNNYGFPSTGSVTTSSTQVNAQDYGPGNYYSSSTFITRSSSPYDWSSVQNDNLRGGVSGLGGENELKNAYIGEVWTPNANTLLYLPLEKDTTDYSGNSISTTASGVSYTTVGGVTSAHIGSSGGISVAAGAVTKDLANMTISLLFYLPAATYSSRRVLMEFNNNSYCNFSILNNANGSTMQTGYFPTTMSMSFSGGTWTSFIVTGNTDGYCLYKDGALVSTGTGDSTPRWNGTGNSSEIGQYIFCGRAGTSNTPFVNGNIREVIFENVKWTATDVANYYNQIKQQLGF